MQQGHHKHVKKRPFGLQQWPFAHDPGEKARCQRKVKLNVTEDAPEILLVLLRPRRTGSEDRRKMA